MSHAAARHTDAARRRAGALRSSRLGVRGEADGFRALAYIDGHHCKLISRKGREYKSWPYLATELAHAVRCDQAILDGEIVCLQPDGRSHFYNLMFRREWPHFMAFDLLSLNGEDLRGLPLHQRKRRLARIMPCVPSRVRLVEQIQRCGVDFFNVACQHDLEGIVAKWAHGTYQTTGRTSWLKIRNRRYSQWTGRRELFERRRVPPRSRWARPEVALM